ncbi:16S rRNA (uracil(1498)-N(3))-methyltransferase [bacterium]|nr:16S rRNA (uracil(1498)-N(3))-methyltransferase [bacterium]
MSKFAYTESIAKNSASFAKDEYQHQIKVLRQRIDNHIDFFDGRGNSYRGQITNIDDRKKWFQVEITESKLHRAPLPLHLMVALPKGGKLDSIIQKAVELGVTKITPLLTARTTIRLNTEKKIEDRMDHWRQIAIASIKQSSNPFLPRIEPPTAISQLLMKPYEGLALKQIVFHPGAENLLSQHKLNFEGNSAVELAFGPEGGFSDDEITTLLGLGFSPLGLGKRILRLETAVVSALTLIQYLRNYF